MSRRVLLSVILLCCCASVNAYDLNKITSKKLENGLTVLILEDHLQPLVSTQVLYKTGARNECVGTTGLAHFVEHMAFRATKNFPDTSVVSNIYAVGGEWHGYTWIDETTYFETVPVKYLDLVLRIQADRMQNALINADEVEAERGSVLTELHSYENDSALVLSDQVLAVSFLEHPYRFNTIGWTSDVEKITHEDIVSFYHRYYRPSNAVLAIVGDVQTDQALQKVRSYFGAMEAASIDSMPRTVEPPQSGIRRLRLEGSSPVNYFQITYRAPAATDNDYPAFLLLQAILGGAPGLNLRQDLDGEPVHSGTRLAAIGRKISTFYMPTADPYVFSIQGQTDINLKTEDLEVEVEKRISAVRNSPVTAEELENAKKQLLTALVFDVETPEDAAHQMAYFAGIGALPILQNLRSLLEKVSPQGVQDVARKYLQPYQRTIGWYLGKTNSSASFSTVSRIAAKRAGSRVAAEALLEKMKNGVPVIVRPIARSPSGFLRILVPTNTVEVPADATSDEPVWRYTSVNFHFLKEDLTPTIVEARKVFDQIWKTPTPDPALQEDPEFRLNQGLEESLGAVKQSGSPLPAVISLAGDIDPAVAFSELQNNFSRLPAPRSKSFPALRPQNRDQVIRLPGKAQSQYGYAVIAPAPSNQASYAFRILLYILTHGYEGRLGKELIAEKGLIYYISSDYKSDGRNGWISIGFGVNPDRLQESKENFERILSGLRIHPPSEEEISEAKQHLIGRRITANQSVGELSAFYAKEWIEQGRLLSDSEFQQKVRSVTSEEVRRAIPAFLDGVRVTVDTRL